MRNHHRKQRLNFPASSLARWLFLTPDTFQKGGTDERSVDIASGRAEKACIWTGTGCCRDGQSSGDPIAHSVVVSRLVKQKGITSMDVSGLVIIPNTLTSFVLLKISQFCIALLLSMYNTSSCAFTYLKQTL